MKSTVPHLLTLTILLLALTASAAELERTDLMPWFQVGPYVGSTIWSDDVGLADNLILGGRAAFLLRPWLGIEGTYGFTSTETDADPAFDTDVQHLGLDLVLNLLPNGRINPYLAGGWSQLDYSSDGNTVVGDEHVFQGWEGAAGLKILLSGHSARRIDLRLEVRDVYTDLTRDFPNDDDWTHNLLATAGVQFTFGRQAGDDDGDGVRNRLDRCPETPAGAPVDLSGCALDSDGDGVIDLYDACADTPAGAPIDERGCPLDSDGDGVFDYADACGETPEGAVVDERGCPLDSDGDGVFDGFDQCADTPGHLKVDEQGCPIEISEVETELLDTGMIRTSQVRFASGTAELSAESNAVLDEIAETLVHWPDLRVEIGGHTDSSGSEAFNQRLSEERAAAVFDYVKKQQPDIRVGQYSVKGYGESQPVADNATVAGRAENRRVEFKVLNAEEIKKVIIHKKMMEK